MQVISDLNLLIQKEEENQEENYYFKTFLDKKNGGAIDELVFTLAEAITPQIDCTQCGNCCKSLMINITETEATELSVYLDMPLPTLKEKYTETSLNGNMIINAIPCHFLKDTRCTIYEHRFRECREFPGLHNPGFTKRLFATFMHYGRCPIIYNVIEELKKETGFNSIHQG